MEFNKGDIIFVPIVNNPLFRPYHYGVYVGNNTVVHDLTPQS